MAPAMAERRPPLVLERDYNIVPVSRAQGQMPATLLALIKSANVAFGVIEPEARIRERALKTICDEPGFALVAVARTGEPYALIICRFVSHVAIVTDIAVNPKHRGRGIGTRLLSAALTRSRESGCTMIHVCIGSTSNERAIAWLSKLGFNPSTETSFQYTRDVHFFLHTRTSGA
jgi:ribosomal protein S18 acetylase RimI-like enzyme